MDSLPEEHFAKREPLSQSNNHPVEPLCLVTDDYWPSSPETVALATVGQTEARAFLAVSGPSLINQAYGVLLVEIAGILHPIRN